MDFPSPFGFGSSSGAQGPRAYGRTRFEDLAREKDADLDVALGAALISRDVYPELDLAEIPHALDRFAAPLLAEGLEEASAEEQASRLRERIFGDAPGAGFRGNETDYYDPKNSLLSDVLTRKLGIPLTLAIVYCEVARRVGVPARGVGFPGHFLVRIERPATHGAKALIVDPFFQGRSLTEEELAGRLTRALGGTDVEAHLVPVSSRAMLVRMLTNLKAIYLTRNERARAHLAVDRISSLLPHAAGPLVERGLLAVQLGAKESARSDLTRALTLHPSDNEARLAREALTKLEKVRSSLN